MNASIGPVSNPELRQYYDAVAPGAWMVESNFDNFEQQYGLPFFEYLEQNPEAWELFNLKMEYGLRDMVPVESVDLLDIPSRGTIVDIGGGLGYILEQIKAKQPALTAILFEQPFVCDQAKHMHGGIDLFQPGDMFKDDLPNADVYILTRILHDWSEDKAVKLLNRIHAAAPNHARLRIIDIFLDEDRQGPPRALQQQRSMELLCKSQQHTVSEIGEMLLKSGWKAHGVPITLSPDMNCLSAVKQP